jgi:hypothetical protein
MAKAAQKQEATAPAQEEQAISMTKAQTSTVKELPTVSARIRYLAEQGYTRSQITQLIPNAKGGKLRYQHVRNVLVTPLANQS